MEVAAVPMRAGEGDFAAPSPETGTTMQGEKVEEAVAKLRGATAFSLTELPMVPLGVPVAKVSTVPEPAHA